MLVLKTNPVRVETFQAVNSPSVLILRIDREGMLDGVITHGT